MRFECVTCLGIYESPLLDGMVYYHACSPLHVVKTVPHGDGTRDIVVGARNRPDYRDENLTLTYRALGDGRPQLERVEPKAEGRGRRELPAEEV